jgi:hypothetical protein
MDKAIARSRQALELQRRILSCLEEIRHELKGLNAAKEG